MTALWAWCQAHPLLAYLAGSSVLSLLWYRIRGAAWPGVETSRLPLAARLAQALVETACNAPGAVRAALGTGGAPPAGGGSSSGPPALLVALALLLLGCGPSARELALDAIPGVPPRDPAGCVDRATRCSPGAVSRPEVCAGNRWWSSMPPRPDGTPRACLGRCVPAEGDVRAHCVGGLP